MFARTQQVSSPLLLPMVGSILTAGIAAGIFIYPPARPTLDFEHLFLKAALDILIVGAIHVVTVWCIWRLIREYVEPSANALVVHIWAAVVWLPLITMLGAERSVWIACFVPWACANGVTFLNLWSDLPQDNVARNEERMLFQPPMVRPLWRILLPHCATILTIQAGLAALLLRHPWSAAALLSAGVMLFLVRHPLVRGVAKTRRRFSGMSLFQTAVVFFLISTALTPYLQKAYGLRAWASLIPAPSALARTAARPAFGSHYSGVILTLPRKPHPHIVPPAPSQQTSFSRAVAKPATIPFDGDYWYFKRPDTRPQRNAIVQQGDPIKANIRSTDFRQLAMEAHQPLTSPISGDCCRAVKVDLTNGDNRPGVIRLELQLRNTYTRTVVSLGTVAIPSSQPLHIPMDRPPVAESLRFRMPEKALGQSFDEIAVIVKPSAERALGGSKIALKGFVLIP